MSKTPIVVSRPLNRVVSNVDAMFFLTIGIVIVSIAVAIIVR